MPNTSYRVQKIMWIEWIRLERWQSKELHDAAFRISEILRDTKPQASKMFYELSDRVQRSNRISTKQLALIQKGMELNFNEVLYVRGLEYWLINNQKIGRKKAKNHATKQAKGIEVTE